MKKNLDLIKCLKKIKEKEEITVFPLSYQFFIIKYYIFVKDYT